MIFRILLFLALHSFVIADAFTITDNESSYDSMAFSFYGDKNSSLTIENIYANRAVFKQKTKRNIGIKKYPVWTYNTIQNKSSSSKNLLFTNPRAGTDFIDVYIFKNAKLLKHHILGDMNPRSSREILYRKSLFELRLEPYQEYEIFTRYFSYGAIDLNWEISEQNEYLYTISKETLLFGFVCGLAFLMAVLIIILNQIVPSVTHKLYFLIIIIALLTQLSISGVLYQYGLIPYLNTIISWSLTLIGVALIGFFPIYFFNLVKIMPKSSKVLLILNYSLVAFALLFLFYPLHPKLLYLVKYANLLVFISSLLLIYISVELIIKKVDGSLFYLLGNTSFTLGAIYFLAVLLGFVNVSNAFYFSLGIGSGVNIFFMAMAIGEKIVLMKREKENALTVMNAYSKLSVLGQSMINISHQWKEPINHIYYAINSIYAAKEFKDPKLSTIIDKSLEEIKNTATHMADTSINFLNYYAEEIKLESISIYSIIMFAKNILQRELDKEHIVVTVKIKYDSFMLLDKSLLSNVFIILFENSIKAFRSQKPHKPLINITLTQENQNVYIEFFDNAGGINIQPIDSIFQKDLSDSDSTGIGLFLAKNILQLKLNGDISVENRENGTMFTIALSRF